MNEQPEIISFQISENLKSFQVGYRQRAIPTVPPSPDKVWKEVYEVKDGIIQKVGIIKGTHTLPSFIGERIEFSGEVIPIEENIPTLRYNPFIEGF